MKVEQVLGPTDTEHLRRRLMDYARVINGQVEFGSPSNGPINMSGTWVQQSTGAANTPFTITHNLGRIPSGMLTFSVDQPGAVITAVNKSAWTTTTAQFQCNVANVNLTGFVS